MPVIFAAMFKPALLAAAFALAGLVPAAAQSAPPPAARSVPAGPHLDRAAYLAVRGDTESQGVVTSWSVGTFDLAGEPIGEMEIRDVVLGDDFAAELESDGRTLHDFRLDRRLTETATLDGPVFVNLNTAAIVHRRAQTYLSFSRGGEAQTIRFGPDLAFDRFWLEAAMGVRAAPAELTVEAGDTALSVIRTPAEGEAQIVFEMSNERSGGGRQADTFRRWLRHAQPIHPDALAQFDPGAGIPARFSYLVVSPDSPEGRREVWTRLDADELEEVEFWPETIAAAGPESYGEPFAMMRHGFLAARQPEGGLDPEDFVAIADRASVAGDRVGAYLILYQARHHYGDCAPQSPSPACRRATEVSAASLGDAEFEQLITTLGLTARDRERAFEGLGVWRSREDLAGAAIHLVSAMTLSALQAQDGEALPDSDPMTYFEISIRMDRYAPLTWWHAGRLMAARGRFDQAWFCFDIARSLPASPDLPILADAYALEGQLHALAPDYFGPDRRTAPPAAMVDQSAPPAAQEPEPATEETTPCIPGVTC